MGDRLLITGCNGQLGKALTEKYPEATAVDKTELDITNWDVVKNFPWDDYDVVINAAAFVNADKSETTEMRPVTWNVNALGPRNLAKVAIVHGLHLIHFSSEYVFDGTQQNHSEEELFSPLSVYGQSKAAADIAVSLVEKHHILRTTWVVGEGHNFVRTMNRLAGIRIDPPVVQDQYGRLTFTSELVRAVDHLLTEEVKYGTYNLTNSGEIKSWCQIAKDTFELSGHDPARVKPITTDEYQKDKQHFAPRPENSDLDLTKIQSTGFVSKNYEELLKEYVEALEKAQ